MIATTYLMETFREFRDKKKSYKPHPSDRQTPSSTSVGHGFNRHRLTNVNVHL